MTHRIVTSTVNSWPSHQSHSDTRTVHLRSDENFTVVESTSKSGHPQEIERLSREMWFIPWYLFGKLKGGFGPSSEPLAVSIRTASVSAERLHRILITSDELIDPCMRKWRLSGTKWSQNTQLQMMKWMTFLILSLESSFLQASMCRVSIRYSLFDFSLSSISVINIPNKLVRKQHLIGFLERWDNW